MIFSIALPATELAVLFQDGAMKIMVPYIFLLLFISYPSTGYAKRVYIDYPDEISINGVDYRASYSEGFIFHKAYIKAFDAKTGMNLWNKKIYTTIMNPFLEHDVQYVLIKEIVCENGKLIIKNEKNIRYVLDLETFEITD